MFKLILQIGLFGQNLVRKKEDFDFKSDFISNNQFKKNIETLGNSNTKRVYTFLKLGFVFLCCVQGVQCVLYNQPT